MVLCISALTKGASVACGGTLVVGIVQGCPQFGAGFGARVSPGLGQPGSDLPAAARAGPPAKTNRQLAKRLTDADPQRNSPRSQR